MMPSKCHHKLASSSILTDTSSAFMFNRVQLRSEQQTGVDPRRFGVAFSRLIGRKWSIVLAPCLKASSRIISEARKIGSAGIRVWCLDMLRADGLEDLYNEQLAIQAIFAGRYACQLFCGLSAAF